jgi:hypothetical protein
MHEVIVTRVPRWWWPFAHSWFILCLSTPAYIAAIKTLTSRGVGLAWYYRVGVAALCLLSAPVIMMLPGILAVRAFWIVRHVRGRPGSRV